MIRNKALANPSWGYRRIWAELRKEGIEVNHKRGYRLYRQAKLQRSCYTFKEEAFKANGAFTGTEAKYVRRVIKKWKIE